MVKTEKVLAIARDSVQSTVRDTSLEVSRKPVVDKDWTVSGSARGTVDEGEQNHP